MSDPSPEPRDKRPSRLTAFFRRKWSWKDIALILLGLSFVSMAGYAFRGPISEALAKFRAGAQGGETVSVFDVIVDRENRQYFDILFDKPLGQGHVGEVLDPAPASISPMLGGSWKWQDTNALHFQPSGGLPVASAPGRVEPPARRPDPPLPEAGALALVPRLEPGGQSPGYTTLGLI